MIFWEVFVCLLNNYGIKFCLVVKKVNFEISGLQMSITLDKKNTDANKLVSFLSIGQELVRRPCIDHFFS
jgi:hypothetical protein